MPDHEFEFHGNHLAVNVKVRGYRDVDTERKLAERLGINWNELINEVWNQICEIFWMQTAPDLAREYGFEGVQSEGNSDGWCVPIYGNKPVERAYLDNIMDEEATGVMKNYFLFRFKIKEVVKNSTNHLRLALEDELRQRELDFLLSHSVTARSMHFQFYGSLA